MNGEERDDELYEEISMIMKQGNIMLATLAGEMARGTSF